ncbi:sarcosine oxidase subunit alpha family protein [Salaquimonas pukyongi]|uniref:sarcosine oxidase subunit alpha family protein n=1 Tax=Salaquimonas pukyongi TaxID=2712698 RepID=UPI00096B84CB|nr:sarcosine oxidase subunit alpha family protein [Salaquimonas pukyongi]
MTAPFRTPSGTRPGLVDRDTPLSFSFNGRQMPGYAGDTLASALIANGVKLVGRSFKYHRPRGIFTAGSEEPNALVTLHAGARAEPNTRATVAELFDGLAAKSQNHRGPLSFDLMAVTDLLSPFLAAGFYYKTFMWPKSFWEKLYEPVIRSAAGLGSLSGEEDPDSYDKGFLHCDVLVIGAGPAGLSAALQAARSGARVILADEDFLPGGRLNGETHEVAGKPGHHWAAQTAAELASMENVRLMTRTTVYGAYDHGTYGALEKKTDHLATSSGKPRQVLWRLYTKRTILAAGSTERPIAFANNDRPGIMLAGAVRTYANRFAALCGKHITIFTNNDDGWRTATDLAQAGVQIAAIVDSREMAPLAAPAGAAIIMGGSVVDTAGRLALKSVTLSNGQKIETDCLAVSGGWNPNVHLTCHQRGRPQWNGAINAFVPGGEMPVGMDVAGSASGSLTLSACLTEGHKAASAAIRNIGLSPSRSRPARASDEPFDSAAFWHVAPVKGQRRKTGSKRAWVDLQNDVTVKDVKLSHQEGYRSVEHLKRYTTMGMATDQGKTSNILGLAILAEAASKSIPETGTTIFRPPYTPVAIGAFAGRSRGKEFRPTRLTTSHQWAQEQGAVFVEAGMWLRAQWYPKAGEAHWRESVDREALAVRNSAGICDVTTLGKIDVQGKDAAAFLDRLYTNTFSTLPVGKVRYGLMLREDGMVYDDGTTARLGEHHFLMTTTTANAVLVFRRMEFARQCLFPQMDVHLISATEQWAQFAVAGPNSRKLLQKIIDADHDISNDAFPFMACGEVTVCGGAPARLFRISFSGELAYEIAVPARYGDALVRRLMEAGAEFGVTPYGTEALNVLRIEKGHATANELNGQTTALNLGLDKMVSKKKDCIGKVMAGREALVTEDAIKLVGFKPVDPEGKLAAGAHFIEKDAAPTTENDQGWMTSVCYSPHLQTMIGLGFIKQGDQRIGDTVIAADPLRGNSCEVEIVSPHFIDPQGERLRA